jgi:hypothetical protein
MGKTQSWRSRGSICRPNQPKESKETCMFSRKMFCCALFALSAALAGRAGAALITDSFLFQQLAVGGGVNGGINSSGDIVSGTFTFDSANPALLLGFSLDAGGPGDLGGLGDSSNFSPVNLLSLPTFNGSVLVGALHMTANNANAFVSSADWSGTFNANGTGTVDFSFSGPGFVASDHVTGPITYTLQQVAGPGPVSGVPLPAGAWGGMLGLAGLACVSRRSATWHEGDAPDAQGPSAAR